MLSLLVVGAGLVAALSAATGIGPFAGLRHPTHSVAAASHLVRTVIPVTPIDASTIFPPPAPPATIQKVVIVYDLPAPGASSEASKRDSAETTSGSGSDPSPRSHPSPTPPPEHHGGGGPPGGTPPGDD